MRRMSWIFCLGAMFLASCAVEPSEPGAEQPASSVTTEAILASPAPSPDPQQVGDWPETSAFTESCTKQCPGEACCRTSNNSWVCC